LIKEAIGIAETVEEALEQAKAELFAELGEDIDFDIDVISQPKKKVLGLFGGASAQVRVFTEIPDPAPKKTNKKSNKGKSENKREKVKAEKEAREDVKEAVDASTLPEGSPAYNAVKYVKEVLAGLSCTDINIKVVLRDGGALLIISGEGLGVVIGHRGETLDALQYLTSLAANSTNGYYKVSIDIGNYRERREKTLISLAHRISAQVIRTGRSRSLEPMNPYERRIIHTAVQEIDGVSSHSVGEGERRHIVITSDNPVQKNTKKNEGNEVAREPKKDSEALPLYGKIK
jgi:spoIIIJ-associated protein